MEKKIIAVACVLVILAVTLAACGSKYLVITDEHGYTHLAVTDAEGNTVLDENGDIQVYVTDESGDPVTLENGAYDVAAVTFPDAVANGNTLETPDYTLTMPDGWTAQDNGRFLRDDTDGNAYVLVTAFGERPEGETVDQYLENAGTMDALNDFAEQLKSEYPDTVLSQQSCVFTAQQLDARMIELRVPAEDGSMYYYAINIYFIYENQLYKADYICRHGSYDETFDAFGALNSGLVMK